MAGFQAYCALPASFHYMSWASTRWDICRLKTSCRGSDFVWWGLTLWPCWKSLIGSTLVVVAPEGPEQPSPARGRCAARARAVLHPLSAKFLPALLLPSCGPGAEEMAFATGQTCLWQGRAQLSSPGVLQAVSWEQSALLPRNLGACSTSTLGFPGSRTFGITLCSSSPSGLWGCIYCSDVGLGAGMFCQWTGKGLWKLHVFNVSEKKKMVSHGISTAGAVSTSVEHPTEWQFEGAY